MPTRADRGHMCVRGLGLELGDFALRDVDLVAQKGEYHILLGPSGSGKSTLMRSILGQHRVGNGTISLGGRDITQLPPERRRMGYVPQNYALFPHLDVERNIRFGLVAVGVPAREADERVDRICDLLGIESLRRRQVEFLSGGERQKVALARALVTQPDAILLDEPFSSIDEGSRRRLWLELKAVMTEIGITALHITHSMEEACVMGERMSVLIEGRIAQCGTSRDLLERPANISVANYLGYRNIFEGSTRPHPAGTAVQLDGFEVVLSRELPVGERLHICARPQDIKIVKSGVPVRDTLAGNVFAGSFVRLFPTTDACVAWFRLEGSDKPFDFELRFPLYIRDRHAIEPGKPVSVAFHEPALVVFRD